MTNNNALFITVTTRNLADPDQPPKRDRINYHRQASRVWLAQHCAWAMHNNHSVTTAPE